MEEKKIEKNVVEEEEKKVETKVDIMLEEKKKSCKEKDESNNRELNDKLAAIEKELEKTKDNLNRALTILLSFISSDDFISLLSMNKERGDITTDDINKLKNVVKKRGGTEENNIRIIKGKKKKRNSKDKIITDDVKEDEKNMVK